ncbi:hypothetical protein HYY75_12395 [bacterium]|nr:hypothetical protein [bacterium]
MIGTLLGSQVLPIQLENASEMNAYFSHTIKTVEIKDEKSFYESLKKVRCLEPDFQRTSFLGLLEKIGKNFTSLAFTGKTWPQFYKEIKDDIHERTKY